jgi:hypothetical protein
MNEHADMELDDEIEEGTMDELAQLKQRADILGVKYPRHIGVDALRKKIRDKMEGIQEEAPEASKAASEPKKKTKAEIEQELREQVQLEGMALVRCRIYNLNPSKRDLQGEIITVANSYLGTVRKFIPFGEATDNGYHIPQVIYDDLKERKFQQIMTKTVNGQIQVNTRMVPEYNIEVLDPLTEEELRELALKQEAAKRLGAE